LQKKYIATYKSLKNPYYFPLGSYNNHNKELLPGSCLPYQKLIFVKQSFGYDNYSTESSDTNYPCRGSKGLR